MSRLGILFVSCIFALSCGMSPARAKPALKAPSIANSESKQLVPTNGLSIRPVHGQNGGFAFCLAEQNYPDGRVLTWARSAAHESNIGITIPNAGFVLSARYDLTMAIDSQSFGTIRGSAIDANTLLLQMGTSAPLDKAMSSGKELAVTAAGKRIGFALNGFDKVLGQLETCLTNNKNKTDAQAQKAEQAMPEPLKALLISAGFKDIEPLSMDNIPEAQRPADFIWQTGNLLGGVRERVAPKDKDLETLVGLHMQGLKTSCRGNFKAALGREDAATPGLKGQKGDAACEIKEGKDAKTLFVAMYFYVSASGKFTVFSFETDLKNKAEASAARDAIKTAIQSLALEANKKDPASPAKK